MSNHKKTIVPIETWCYNSPELRYNNKIVDLGLFAESLIYYDQPLINISSPIQLLELVKWFTAQNKFPLLLKLFKDNIIGIYEFSFVSVAASIKGGKLDLLNIQDEAQKEENSFIKRYLYDKSFIKEISTSKRIRLSKCLENSITEVKADEYGATINDARNDMNDSRRNAHIAQSLIETMFPVLGLKVPQIECEIKNNANGDTVMTYNIDFNYLKDKFGSNLNFHESTLVTGATNANRLIWASSKEDCDLYLGSPMSHLVGDKLFEIGHKAGKPKDILKSLSKEVEFPDIRKLVNSNQIGIEDIMTIRKKAKRFRQWLQSESDRDRDAIIAYHNEVGKEIGFVKYSRKTLNLFGTFGAPILGLIIGGTNGDLSNAIIGSTIGSGVGRITNQISNYNKDWKPIVFGSWLDNKIIKLMDK